MDVNYLAHLYLADDCDDSLIGNLLGDFVKGRPEGRYARSIAEGIRFHRRIDSFCDAHPVTGSSRNRIGPQRRRFAGIIVDVCYDHFLARHWQRFHTRDLPDFSGRIYSVLEGNRRLLPERLNRMLPFMISEDWLGSYVHLQGVAAALDRIAGRLTRGERFMSAVTEIESNYETLEKDFLSFFPDLVEFSRSRP